MLTLYGLAVTLWGSVSLLTWSFGSLLVFSLVSFIGSYNSFSLFLGVVSDEVSLFLLLLTVFVLFSSSFYAVSFSKAYLALYFMLVPCFLVFTTQNLFVLYIFYELSLVPILYIILKWGSYPERSLSSMMLLVYTSIFTLPFLGCLSLLLGASGSFSFLSAGEFSFSSLATLIVFFGFAVNLPIYGLHYWLPIAHVEAPTFGSMILAGILLKLGGAGLLRLSVFIDISFLREVLLSYFLFSIIVSALVCCFQSDFKRLVAYSSVFHIITVPLLLVVGSPLSENAIVCVLVFHGLSSPILFMLVGVLYSMYSSRQLVLARGVLLASPFLAFILVASFFFTLSAPPYPSFYSEVIFLVSCYSLTPLTLVFFLPLVFLSLLYNLNWLVSLVFGSLSSSQVSMSSSLSLSSAIPLALSHVFSVGFLLLISSI